MHACRGMAHVMVFLFWPAERCPAPCRTRAASCTSPRTLFTGLSPAFARERTLNAAHTTSVWEPYIFLNRCPFVPCLPCARDLTTEEQAKISVYNFDHPNAFAWGEMTATLRELKAGRSSVIPRYDFVTSSRLPESIPVDSADVILFEGILAFYSAGMLGEKVHLSSSCASWQQCSACACPSM